MSRKTIFLWAGCLAVCAGMLLTGCQKDAAVSKSEEYQFNHPSKEIPPEAVKRMQQMQQEAAQKKASENPAGK